MAASLVSLDALTSALPPGATAFAFAGAVCVLLAAAVVFHRRLERLLRDLRAGLSVLRRPRVMGTRVLPWLLAGRAVRLLAFALVLTAAGASFGLGPALVLMALQGATPSAGAVATAARIALLAVVLTGTGVTEGSPERVAETLAAAYGGDHRGEPRRVRGRDRVAAEECLAPAHPRLRPIRDAEGQVGRRRAAGRGPRSGLGSSPNLHTLVSRLL